MVQVIDGDTILLGPTPLRLHGIDAPEQGQRCNHPNGGTWPCGDLATRKLAELTEDRRAICTVLDHDRYGRVIARCEVDGADLGAAMMDAGLAWAFRQFSDDYVPYETRAAATGIGIWSWDNQPPWAYRATRWERAAAEAPGHCPIKGNINRQGERIYHTPWSPWYSRTLIDETAGERWFCDEGEAVAAGWRAARWR